MHKNQAVLQWVEAMAKRTRPDQVVWVDGSAAQKKLLIDEAVLSGELIALDQKKLPGCYYHRTHENDVARMEHLTFICTPTQVEAGPSNHWMHPQEAYQKLGAIFDGCMQGRTMYVIPYLMGPPNSEFSKVGVTCTDSLYVTLSMLIMTRVGEPAMQHLGEDTNFVKGLHSKADLDPQKRYICHFPKDNTIWSVGSAYGGNALLGKKCFALRIASYMGRQEGWMAEHMLILGVEDPKGKVSYIAAAFPSACGKTNLAMLIPPLSQAGYKVWTVGDDIAWMRIGKDGRLYAVNPEAGFFGVAPGTSFKTNPNAMHTVQKNTIFTNVVLKADNTVWWEGMDEAAPHQALDWKGQPWPSEQGGKGAHPNARFTSPAAQCPSISPEWEDPQGVPITAILFGGRRAKVAPLVYEAFDWNQGVLMGATMASETTAAATGQVGLVRRDPMAMLPFCGYHMGDYFAHWIAMGKRIPNPPKIFHVNWFRTNEEGKYLWPGYGENLRVLKWILARCHGEVGAQPSELGYLPHAADLDVTGLAIEADTLHKLLKVDIADYIEEIQQQEAFFKKLGDRMPQALILEHERLKNRFGGEKS